MRIAIGMDSDTEKDDDIFFYCDTLEDMKSLAEIDCEDFYIAVTILFSATTILSAVFQPIK